MNCPHCQKPLKDKVTTWRQNRRRQGLCAICGKPSAKFYRCLECRNLLRKPKD